jgi:hypothetical protein
MYVIINLAQFFTLSLRAHDVRKRRKCSSSNDQAAAAATWSAFQKGAIRALAAINFISCMIAKVWKFTSSTQAAAAAASSKSAHTYTYSKQANN